jgi:hypothetical protein
VVETEAVAVVISRKEITTVTADINRLLLRKPRPKRGFSISGISAFIAASRPYAICSLYYCFPNILISTCGPLLAAARILPANDNCFRNIPIHRRSTHNRVQVKQVSHRSHRLVFL